MVTTYESTRCVVLNSTYEPLDILSSKRAINLILKGKAMVVEEHPMHMICSESMAIRLPTTIVLKKYVKGRKVYTAHAALTQKNLFSRDNYTCQYCNRHKTQLKSFEFLTRDHIHPESKGGPDTWENLVTACSTCNNKKADYLLSEVSMKLLKTPTKPSVFELWMKNGKRFH
jgi:5-methylcytosine-specific restriction endonuclease McrA